MKNPNGYGGISKLPGNRPKPYRVRLTAGWQYQTELEEGIRLAYEDFLQNPMRAER